MEQVLNQLHFEPTTRSGNQWHGPCPVHGSTSPNSRSFSVTLDAGRYFCHKCRSHGNALELWAAVHKLRVLARQAWYLIARPEGETTPRNLRVVRFRGLRLIDRAASVPADFDLRAHLGNAWDIFRGEQSYDVEIHFAREAAVQVTETRWHDTQKVKHHRDGSVTLSFRVDGLDEILWWLLPWTGFARVIEPPELRQRLVEQLEEGLKMNRIAELGVRGTLD